MSRAVPGKVSKPPLGQRATEKLLAADADIVVLAHHADDQAETVLLQLLRGAGPAGLAAMPRHRARDAAGPALLRPLLELPRATLAAYANARGLAWIDDESNADRRHKRNLLRLDVAPLLAQAFPGYPSVLVRAAGHQAEASALLDELARAGRRRHAGRTGPRGAYRACRRPAPAICCAGSCAARGCARRPPRGLPRCLPSCRQPATDARTRIVHDGAEIGCHRGRVVVHAAAAGPYARGWRGESSVELPGGVLRFERTHGDGIAAAKFDAAAVTLRSRHGGERIQLAANRPRRAVKKLLYDAQLPIWRRAGAAVHLVRRRAGRGSGHRRRAGVPGRGPARPHGASTGVRSESTQTRAAPDPASRPCGPIRQRALIAVRRAGAIDKPDDQGLNAHRTHKNSRLGSIFHWRSR